MSILIVGDIHAADRPPSIRTDEYSEQVLAKLQQTVAIAEEHDVEAVIWAGDAFHVKAQGRTSHGLVRGLVEVGQEYRRWLIVPGNHDMAHNRIESIPKQPLGVLYRAGAVQLCGQITLPSGLGVFGFPWLQDWTEWGPWMKAWKTSSAKLMVAHAPLYPPAYEPYGEFFDTSTWASMMEREGHVYYGHVHDAHGVHIERSTEDPDIFETHTFVFCNNGAISRGSLNESDLTRVPTVTLYDPDSSDIFTPIELEYLPAETVFKLAVKEVSDIQTERLSEFLEQVGRTELEGLSIEAVLAHVEGMDIKPETRQQIQECLEVALNR